MRTTCSREIFTKKCRQEPIFDSDLKGAWQYNHVHLLRSKKEKRTLQTLASMHKADFVLVHSSENCDLNYRSARLRPRYYESP